MALMIIFIALVVPKNYYISFHGYGKIYTINLTTFNVHVIYIYRKFSVATLRVVALVIIITVSVASSQIYDDNIVECFGIFFLITREKEI